MASTKAFTCQLTALFILAMYLGQTSGYLDESASRCLVQELLRIPGKLETVLSNDSIYEGLARELSHSTDALFLGRGIHFPIALEGALKLKEISYIHAEGYPAGEMKHGPNALIDEKLPVVVLATHDQSSDESRMLYEKTLSNIQEVKAREGIVIAVATQGDEDGPQDGRPRHRDSADAGSCWPRSWKSCRCNCWRTTSRCAAAAMWTSRATWPRASRLSSPGLRQFTHRLPVPTNGKGSTTSPDRWRSGSPAAACSTGLLTVFVQHTSASLTIQENADPDVVHDLNEFFSRLVSEDNRLYRHTIEGPDDMPAHIRAALTLTQLSIPVEEGRLALGTWQGIYVFEHRAARHRRSVVLHLLGE